MTSRLVFRLLDEHNQLLGWSEDYAEALGDGCLRASSAIGVIAEQSGIPHRVSIHWVDVNVETKVTLDRSMPVSIGDTITIFRRGMEVIRVGPQAGGLASVTVRSPVAILVPTGGMSAIGRL